MSEIPMATSSASFSQTTRPETGHSAPLARRNAAAARVCDLTKIGKSGGGEAALLEAEMKILLAFAILVLAVSPVRASQQADEVEIGRIQARWDDAWNRHDIKALSALVAEDVRFVNVAGNVLNGRDEFEKLQTRTHATQFKDSARTVTGTDIKFLTSDIAVAHVRWGMKGDKDTDGTPRLPRSGVMMQVLVKRSGTWTIVAVQNTNVR
jgi:uncharacterized protein (TIGR02246 family)